MSGAELLNTASAGAIAAAQGGPVAPWYSITLVKPIEVMGELKFSLDLRRPTADMLIKCGLHVAVIDDEQAVSTRAIVRYIGHLAAWPPGAVAQLEASEFLAAMNAIVGFLGQERVAI